MVTQAEQSGAARADAARHPLDPLSAEEIRQAVTILRKDGRVRAATRFVSVTLHEPPKTEIASFAPGQAVRREAFVVMLDPREHVTYEAVVSITAGSVLSCRPVPGARAPITLGEYTACQELVQANREFREGLRRRGIGDPGLVLVEPWGIGGFARDCDDGRRLVWTLCFYRAEPHDNPYAKPIGGLHAIVDLDEMTVVRVEDLGVVPLPPDPGNYTADTITPRDPVKPLEIRQPEGVSFEVDGWSVRWQKWHLRLGFTAREGLVLHTIGYEDGDRVRPILHRASVSEMVVPYGHTGPMHNWKNAFDAGEWGLGRMANSLTLGCDCLGEIRYLDVTFGNERGEPYTIENAICMHEEDYSILWKHVDLRTGTTEVRRQRRLVISSIATVGNYEYGFYWYFYLDGSMQLEVKLTGVMSTMAVDGDGELGNAAMVAPQLAAPYHQHLFNVRLDFDVDGTANTVYEVDSVAAPDGPDNPLGNAFTAEATPLETEQQAQRVVDPSRSRCWKIVNPEVRNRLGEPVGYKLVPASTPTLLARPESSVGRRATFATRNLWVTPHRDDERRAAGDYPNQHGGGDGLPRWTEADRPVAETDVVVWHTFGLTHIPRPEDWPVMPVESTGFLLMPVGFFDRNPALDVPPSPGHCDGEADA
jgi:primary-amine oxidase